MKQDKDMLRIEYDGFVTDNKINCKQRTRSSMKQPSQVERKEKRFKE